MLPKLNYPALLQAYQQVLPKLSESQQSADADAAPPLPSLPRELPPADEPMSDELVTALHKILFDIHIKEGALICPDTRRRFPIKDSIPNMILHEDEI